MHMSDLQSKEIIDISSGRKLGRIVDILVDTKGNITKLILDKKISLNYDNEYEELYINGDFNRLKQVFVNIIKNSMESIGNSGIINIRVEVVSDLVNVIISDNGCGMTQEELSSIKEMFFSTKKDGTGLGVALSNEIIEAHMGKLNYSSVKNEGTVCTVSLPL